MIWMVMGLGAWFLLALIPVLNERGGGSDPQPAQVIPAPSPPSAEQIGESSAAQFEAQLKYNPQLAQQQADIQQQYGPQLAQTQTDIFGQQAPLVKAIISQLFPAIPVLEGQVGQRLQSPQGLTPEQQFAQEQVRNRSRDQVSQNIRSQANLGGTLYGGNRELREDRAQNELEQAFATQDIALQDQRRQQTLSELATLFQLAFPSVQQPNVPQPNSSGTTNAVLQALIANQGNFGIVPGTPGQPGFFGGLADIF